MKNFVVADYDEWVALVGGWIAGVSHPDDNLRTTATLTELMEFLHVPDAGGQMIADFQARDLSTTTYAFAREVAGAGLKPPAYPSAVIWHFNTTPPPCEFIDASLRFQD